MKYYLIIILAAGFMLMSVFALAAKYEHDIQPRYVSHELADTLWILCRPKADTAFTCIKLPIGTVIYVPRNP